MINETTDSDPLYAADGARGAIEAYQVSRRKPASSENWKSLGRHGRSIGMRRLLVGITNSFTSRIDTTGTDGS